QAEDGIRDFHVTGVQTCALPILNTVIGYVNQIPGVEIDLVGTGGQTLEELANSAADRLATTLGSHNARIAEIMASDPIGQLGARSEERRVGKEGRWRWAT